MAITIDYTAIDFDALKAELITYLKETKTFKDVEFASSNINTIVELHAYLGSLFGYYINSIANEPFLPSAKKYKNLNRIARILSYNPRGDQAASVDVVGSLDPAYCFGKEDAYFEIPAYSSFLSNKTTPNGENFSFTNKDQVIYVIKGFGINPVDQINFTYDGSQLPVTKPTAYWNIQSGGTTGTTGTTGTSGTPSFDPEKLILNLSDTIPLSILDRLDPSNYKNFDPSIPLYNGSDASSVGQPFNRNINTTNSSVKIIPGKVYYIIFNFDIQTSTPYLSIMEEGNRLEERRDDIMISVILEKENNDGTHYTLRQIQNNSKGRFYTGVLGTNNLDSISFSYDKLENTTNGIKKVYLDINKSGDKPPFEVLVDGVVYSFKQGQISSQTFDINSWDVNQSFYNINLNIVSPDSPDTNYDASLTVTSKEPGINEVTIAKIYPSYIDPTTGIKALDKDPGQRYGNLQAIPQVDITTTEQRTGYVYVPEGVTSIFVAFDTPFTKTTIDESVDYIIELTPEENVQLWYSDKSENGFTINIEPNSGFIGKVNWLATRFKTDEVKQTPVFFDESMPTIDGLDADYTIFLSASDNVRVWYSDKTSNGFKINTEKRFNGTISYSTFVSSSNQVVVAEKDASTQKKGVVVLTQDNLTSDITFDVPFNDVTYGLHMVANKNFNVWYTNKTQNGFTINVEPGFEDQIVIDWFADQSSIYQYQKHGMVSFTGQITNGSLPGLRYTNIAETFIINDLKQGSILFSYINKNGAINTSNNNLNISYTADRKSQNEIKFQINQLGISYTDIRVFVKNDAGDWEEWVDSSSQTKTIDITVGEKVFFVRVNEYQNIEISFGDGINFGLDPQGKEIIVFGLKTVGKDGNVPPNSLSSSVLLSKNILGDDDITIQFEQQFIQLIGLKNDTAFAADETFSNTSIYDSEGTKLTETELTIKQSNPAFGGNFIETVEELRSNASTANLRQDRIVSLEDYKSFCDQYFSDYIIKTQVLSYSDLKNTEFAADLDLSNYWFNYIFIIALPKYGDTILKTHRDYILNTLNKKFKAMATVEHELFSAKMIPIDIRIRFKPTKFGSPTSIQSSIKTNLKNYFDRNNHEMGETIEIGPIQKLILNIPEVQNAEIAMNKNINNKLKPADYDTDATTTATETVQEVKRRKILEILAKDPSLLTIVDPLFDIKDTKTNQRKWVLSQDLELNKYEFPILGNIIIEVEQ